MVFRSMPTQRVRLLLFAALIVLGAGAARIAEYARGQGLPWHGLVDGWWSFAAVAIMSTLAAWAGSEIGRRWGGAVWCVLFAATLGGIGAVLGNASLGALWGLIIGGWRTGLWTTILRWAGKMGRRVLKAVWISRAMLGAGAPGWMSGFGLLRSPFAEMLLGTITVIGGTLQTWLCHGPSAKRRRWLVRTFWVLSCGIVVWFGRFNGVRNRVSLVTAHHSRLTFAEGFDLQTSWNGPVLRQFEIEDPSDMDLATLGFLRQERLRA